MMRKKRRRTKESRNASMLRRTLAREGFDLWHHFFWGVDEENGERRAFFIEFLRLNPELHRKKKEGPTLTKSDYSFAMVRVGMLAKDESIIVAEFFGEENVSVSRRVLSLRFGSNICLEDSTKGGLVHDPKGIGCRFGLCRDGAISWDLRIQKQIDYHLGFAAGKIARFFDIADMYWDIGGVKATFDGRITVGDREFKVNSATSWGFQDKTWGHTFSREWVKLYGGQLTFKNGQEVPNSALIVARGTPVFRGYSLGARYFMVLYYEDKIYDFTTILHDKNYFYKYDEHVEEGILSVHIEAVKLNHRLVCTIRTAVDSLVPLNYPTPQGSNFSYFMSSETAVSLELYKSAPLLAWELEAQFKVTGAALQTNHSAESIPAKEVVMPSDESLEEDDV